MKVVQSIKSLPEQVKKQACAAFLLACMIVTFIAPAVVGGYTVLKDPPMVGEAAAIEDVDLLLVAASAFGEARKAMNATDPDKQENFVNNTTAIVGSKWQNMGLIVGARDALSGSIWSAYQAPITLSKSEVETYNSNSFTDAYNKYKAFGLAVQNLNNKAQNSSSSAVSIDEGLDAMSVAAIKLGGFGVKFLKDYNPAPVLLSLYNSNNLSTHSSNKFIQLINSHSLMRDFIKVFGDPVVGRVSLFVGMSGAIAVFLFALSMFLVLLGNKTLGDSLRSLCIRVIIGGGGIFIIAWAMDKCITFVSDSVDSLATSPTEEYIENNLNLYDWYQTGFAVPGDVGLTIDSSGQFVFTTGAVKAINEYTYQRLTGSSGSAEQIQARMEASTLNGNIAWASLITPSTASYSDGGETTPWATDVYYAVMKNYAENKDDLMDGSDDESSPLFNKGNFRLTLSKYLYMSYLNLSGDASSGYTVTGSSSTTLYGLNPISAFNLIRTDFSGEAIASTAIVYPAIAHVAFDVTNGFSADADQHMNSITRFIASFTLVLAALKGLITIFTAGFGGILSGGVKTITGSSHGLGQALGAVLALIFGVLGISAIMSMSLTLLDIIYGMAKDLLVGTEVVEAFLEPLQETVGKVPVIGTVLMKACKGIANTILTLVLALTFPKLGGIPITVFAQYVSDIPGRIAEKAQMIEGMLLSGRSGGGGGLGGSAGRGQYGRMAQQLAGNAFASGTRQAASVVKAGTMAAGALAGASLSAAGKALNKKGDAIEGKPVNPGIKNWDDLSPEQQAKAAELAAATENWDDLSDDKKEELMKENGVYDNGNAETGGTETPQTEQTIENEPVEEAETLNPADPDVEPADPELSDDAPVGDAAPAEQTEQISSEESVAVAGGAAGAAGDTADVANGRIEDNTVPIGEVGSEQSMNPVSGTDGRPAESGSGGNSKPVEGVIPASSSDPAAAAPAPESVGEGHIEGGGEHVIGGSGDKQGDVQITNSSSSSVSEGAHVQGGNQTLENKPNVQNTADIKDVNAQQISEVEDMTASNFDNYNNTSSSTGDVTTMAGGAGASGLNQLPDQATGGSFGAGGSPYGGSGSPVAPHVGGGVNQFTDQSRKKTDVNTRAEQKLSVGGVTDNSQSQTLEQASGDGKGKNVQPMSTGQGIGGSAVDKKADQTGGKGIGGMDGTSKSAWGKDMTIKEQKQARFAHAAGDALQMMGGNRSMSDGLRDAFGYAAEGMASAVVPPDLMSTFAQDIRNRRQLRTELRRHDLRNGNGGGNKK